MKSSAVSFVCRETPREIVAPHPAQALGGEAAGEIEAHARRSFLLDYGTRKIEYGHIRWTVNVSRFPP
jgi:hypothetical protein